MGKHTRLLSILLILSLFSGCLPATTGKAAADYNMVCTTKGGTYYVKTADEAMDVLEKDGGGVIRMCQTMEFSTTSVRYLSENMKIIVPESILITIQGAGIQGPGSFEVYGTLDLINSTCTTFHITGAITSMGRGEVLREVINVGYLDKTSDIAAVIQYGQRLPDDSINDLLVGTRVYRSGYWHYQDQSTVFEAGTHTVSVYYDYSRTVFSPVKVEEKVQIQVEKTTPVLSQYDVPEIELGQTLKSAYPKYSVTNPYTKEQVAGTLVYSDLESTFHAVGSKLVKASFVPSDKANYNTAEFSLEITVVPASPTVVSNPYAGQGEYGQALGDVVLSQGKCVDTGSGDAVEGTWSWKNDKETLVLGEHSYLAVFTPKDTENYKKTEVSVSVQTVRKKIAVIQWPDVSPLIEGQYLFEAALSFSSSEYGNYIWEDEAKLPSSEFKGAVLVFVPYDKENYDWSYVAGYDAATQSVKKTMALQIVPVATDTPKPVITAEPTKTPPAVSTAAATPTGTPQSAATESPGNEAETDEPVIIKKMVSTISKIKTPTSEKAFTNRSKIKSIQHSAHKIKIQIKKVKNANYEVRLATGKGMKKPKKKTSSKSVIVFRHLKKGQYYYIQSRVWKVKQGKHTYSKWSRKQKVRL